jgi:hypothetical protein
MFTFHAHACAPAWECRNGKCRTNLAGRIRRGCARNGAQTLQEIGQDIAADPELAPDLIEPFKSKGIGEDGTLIIKASSTAKPGKQSMIRRAALRAAQNAFRENGIKAVPKPMTANAEPEP